MPNPNLIVALVNRINPPVKKTGADTLKENPDGISIDFEGAQTARLLPKDHAAEILEIIEELRRMRSPVYVETHPDTKEITRLLIPLTVKVANILESEVEEVGVELEISHARHVLKRANPDFGELLKELRTAQEENAWLIVTETDEHEIIDVRPCLHEPTLPDQLSPTKKKGPRGLLCRWFRCFCCICKYLRCVSPAKAKQIFDLVSAQTCAPLTVPAPCIPFLYPDDGCWGRAHEMRRLIVAAGITPKKVWIYGSLHTNTKNNPQCYVNWGWHVAPTICVRRFFCRVENMVIDPSLFTEPVSKTTWKSVQGDPNAQLVDTDGSIFYRSYSGSTQTDPNYVQTAQVLATYRQQLKLRSLGSSGPPPYAYCP